MEVDVSSYVAGDACSHSGAVRLAGVIEQYWRKRGVRVTVTIVPIWESQQRQIHCLRSNLFQ